MGDMGSPTGIPHGKEEKEGITPWWYLGSRLDSINKASILSTPISPDHVGISPSSRPLSQKDDTCKLPAVSQTENVKERRLKLQSLKTTIERHHICGYW